MSDHSVQDRAVPRGEPALGLSGNLTRAFIGSPLTPLSSGTPTPRRSRSEMCL